jgi:GDP dissociation inhibitor
MSSISQQEAVNHLTATADANLTATAEVNPTPTADVNEKNLESMEQSELSQHDQTAERSDEKSSTGRYDLIIDGTGLVASIVACATSRSGKTVLHIDSNDYYGCNSASFPLEDYLTWCRASSSQDIAHSADKEEKFVEEKDAAPICDTTSKISSRHCETPLTISDTTDLHVHLNPTPSFVRVIQFQDISE